MQRLISNIFLCLAALSFSACNSIETPEGKIPAAFSDAAQEKLGIYMGALGEQKAGRLELIREGDFVRAEFIDPGFGLECQARLGSLKRVSGKEISPGKYSVREAVFALDPNLRAEKIPARELKLVWSAGGSATASFVSKSVRIRTCENDVVRDISGASSMREINGPCAPELFEDIESSPLEKLVI